MFEIRSYFDQVTTADEISHSKPDPEIYLKAADKLGVNPKDCITFEDTVSGIKSAKNAGMYVIALTTTHGADELISADWVIGSFKEVSVENLKIIGES
jgi:beta-phosphoglucomutase-like phosphatase (HAD superfamily)